MLAILPIPVTSALQFALAGHNLSRVVTTALYHNLDYIHRYVIEQKLEREYHDGANSHRVIEAATAISWESGYRGLYNPPPLCSTAQLYEV